MSAPATLMRLLAAGELKLDVETALATRGGCSVMPDCWFDRVDMIAAFSSAVGDLAQSTTWHSLLRLRLGG